MAEMITPEMVTIAIASLAALTFLLLLITIVSLSRVKKRLSAIKAQSLELDEKSRLLDAADKIVSFESRLDTFENVVSESQNQLTGHESKINDHAEMFGKVSQMAGQHVAGLAEAADKITSIESRLDGFNKGITEKQNQLTRHESTINDHAAMFGKVSQMTVQHAAGLSEAADKIKSIESRLDGFNSKITVSQNQLMGHESKLNDHDTLLGQTCQMMGKNAANLTRTVKRIDALEEKYQDLKAFQSAVEQTRSLILEAFGAIQTKILPNDILTAKRNNLQDEARIASGEKLLETEDFDISSMHRD